MLLKFVRNFVLISLFLVFSFSNSKQIIVKNNFSNSYNAVENSKAENTKSNKEMPIGLIKIPKINLNKPLYAIYSNLNDVNKNIEILKSSNMPSDENGNFILAAHSGYSFISYFHNLYKLDIDDEVMVNYNSQEYTYKISKIYEVLKTGKVSIKRDKNKSTITMITCKGSDKQLVVIGYLV